MASAVVWCLACQASGPAAEAAKTPPSEVGKAVEAAKSGAELDAAKAKAGAELEASRAEVAKAEAAKAEAVGEVAKAEGAATAANAEVAAVAAKAEAAKAEVPATTPAVGVKVGKWTLESATWSDGGAAGLTEAPARSIGACLRTVKKKRAEVVVKVAGGEVARAEVKGESLKCVEELRGVDTPEVGRDGEFTAIYVQ